MSRELTRSLKASANRLLRRGDRIMLHESRDGARRGTVSENQIAGDACVYFYLDGDDPEAIDYGKRTAWRHELSFCPDVIPLRRPLFSRLD
jgi:hypothetical protein